MQNQLLAMLHGMAQFLRRCWQRGKDVFFLSGFSGASGRLEMLVLSADFDSSRLDAVSRSVLWGAGVLTPDPKPAAVYSSCAARCSAPLRDVPWRHCRLDD
ncbi:MAG: hypothetical protein ACKV0T_29445 [Planctomycetales bacterium]